MSDTTILLLLLIADSTVRTVELGLGRTLWRRADVLAFFDHHAPPKPSTVA